MTSEKINYIEMPASDLEGTKTLFTDAFGWMFEDYGPDYAAILDAGIDGGFFRSDQVSRTDSGSALVVLRSFDLEASLQKVVQAGGEVVKQIYSFPGGRRFHFTDPSGNEYAVWSE
ncbi:VOC family protein [Haliea sp. E1-2-M8]|uniref:VOC family protein n=1 Tax=Haliea sp. E1-2-M8 TaxID=3064706 RepID=UPI002721395F|nr:VOC family protein [Haliea sp. E1-2-M8]MDO8860867.1 VOC family protein [Haliea sp. E1-2-M8]